MCRCSQHRLPIPARNSFPPYVETLCIQCFRHPATNSARLFSTSSAKKGDDKPKFPCSISARCKVASASPGRGAWMLRRLNSFDYLLDQRSDKLPKLRPALQCDEPTYLPTHLLTYLDRGDSGSSSCRCLRLITLLSTSLVYLPAYLPYLSTYLPTLPTCLTTSFNT